MTNILRSKVEQTMKLGQLIEYDMENIFLENHTQYVMGKLFRCSFLKTKYFWMNSLKFYTACFKFMEN